MESLFHWLSIDIQKLIHSVANKTVIYGINDRVHQKHFLTVKRLIWPWKTRKNTVMCPTRPTAT